MLDSRLGVTLPTGGAIVDDVYGNYQELGWRPLVHGFFLKNLTSRGFIPKVQWKKEPEKSGAVFDLRMAKRTNASPLRRDKS